MNVELGPFGKIQRTDFYHAVLLWAVGDMDSPIQGQAIDFAELVVNVGAEGGYPVGAEGGVFRGFVVNLLVGLLELHGFWILLFHCISMNQNLFCMY